MKRIAILGYHKVGPPPLGSWETWFSIPETIFVEQLTFLRDGGWQPLDAAAFLHGLRRPDSLPERAALITFDDGYRTLTGSALACLRRFGYPGVVFVSTAYVAGRNGWDSRNGSPDEAICGWDELRELERYGITVQSHGITHRPFSELSNAEQADEIIRSKVVLEQGLGHPIDLFAFPYGDEGREGDDLGEAFERCGYRAAFGYGGGPETVPPGDCYRLSRLAMGPDTDLQTELALQ